MYRSEHESQARLIDAGLPNATGPNLVRNETPSSSIKATRYHFSESDE